MNEAEIAEKLKANIPKPIHVPPTIEEPQPEQVDDPKQVYPNQLMALRLSDYFEVERENKDNRHVLDQINTIYQWTKEQINSGDPFDVINHLRRLEGQLGLTFRGGEKLDSIYKYVRLDQERRQLEKEMALI